jgi:hypothetical protein
MNSKMTIKVSMKEAEVIQNFTLFIHLQVMTYNKKKVHNKLKAICKNKLKK